MEGIPLSLPCTASSSNVFCYKPVQWSSTRLQHRPAPFSKLRSELRIKAPSATDSSSSTSTTTEEITDSSATPVASPATSSASATTTETSDTSTSSNANMTSSTKVLDKELTQAVRKTAATFAPRASTKTKNPAVPGSTLYTVFEVQGYLSMALGGLLSFNLVFPSTEPDIWRLMGMWSVWMFTIPSLRARDCSNKEKDALNYLFLVVPLINVLLPIFWKSFAAVWSADVVAFFLMYAWKLDWLSLDQKADS